VNERRLRDGQFFIFLFPRDDVYFTSTLYLLKQTTINQLAHLRGHYATELVNNLILSLSGRFVGRGYIRGGGKLMVDYRHPLWTFR